jgi:hypothetical protein
LSFISGLGDIEILSLLSHLWAVHKLSKINEETGATLEKMGPREMGKFISRVLLELIRKAL